MLVSSPASSDLFILNHLLLMAQARRNAGFRPDWVQTLSRGTNQGTHPLSRRLSVQSARRRLHTVPSATTVSGGSLVLTQIRNEIITAPPKVSRRIHLP